MKAHLYLGLLATGLLLSGCSPSSEPIIKGDLKFCLLRLRPDGSSSQQFTSGRIEIYEHFICVTETNGLKHVGPHDWFSQVSFK